MRSTSEINNSKSNRTNVFDEFTVFLYAIIAKFNTTIAFNVVRNAPKYFVRV